MLREDSLAWNDLCQNFEMPRGHLTELATEKATTLPQSLFGGEVPQRKWLTLPKARTSTQLPRWVQCGLTEHHFNFCKNLCYMHRQQVTCQSAPRGLHTLLKTSSCLMTPMQSKNKYDPNFGKNKLRLFKDMETMNQSIDFLATLFPRTSFIEGIF